MSWGATARRAQSMFPEMIGKVVDVGPVGYALFEGRDQFELARDFQVQNVTDKRAEELYASLYHLSCDQGAPAKCSKGTSASEGVRAKC